MGSSASILELLLADVRSFIGQSDIVYENFRELPEDLEQRTINKARIAVYDNGGENVTKIGADKPAEETAMIAIDISHIRGYRNDNASRGEIPVLRLKDKIIEWIKQLDVYTVTGGRLHSLGYDGAMPFTRRHRYVTRTINCSGFRDLNSQQDED